MKSKGFLQSMNFARWIMVAGGLGAIVLAANGWRLHGKRVELETALAPDGEAETIANNIQYLGRLATKLESDVQREGLGAQSDPILYFRSLAADKRVQMGQVEIVPQNPQSVYKGTVDQQYTIKPQNDKGFMRDRIANYMWLLEQQSRRVRVTHVQMTQEQRTAEQDFGNDLWKWSFELTSRSKEEKREEKAR